MSSPSDLLTQLTHPFPLDRRTSPDVLCSGAAKVFGDPVSHRDGTKLSINHLSNGSPCAETSPYTRHPSSPLSSRARGVNRPETILHNIEDVEIAVAETASGQSRSLRLEIVQHPDRTAEFGSSALTRLPLAPPLIAQLIMRDSAGRAIIDEAELPFLVAQLSLLSSDGSTPMDYVTDGDGRSSRERLLYGNLVSSPHLLRNLQGRRGVYFMFPDVSIRHRGRFQLKVTLLRLPWYVRPPQLLQHARDTIVAEARSLPFDVYPLRDYVAPAQTPLTQYFLQQGARMIPPPPRSL
ncbi:velvet factor-domain-containing protein [Daedaleopsis nitida]|nr:velvet factor-domain-containing protein [Daedaleopsis nitida]